MHLRKSLLVLSLKFRRARWWVKALSLAVVGMLLLLPVYFWLEVRRTLHGAAEQAAAAARVEVEQESLTRPLATGFKLLLNYSAVRAVTEFNDAIYAATSGGLVRLQQNGTFDRAYTVLDGLPENDLTTLAVYQDRLYLGTRHEGLLAFDGTNFTRYRFKRPVAAHITVLLPTPGELLIGTFDGGLFEFDGQNFTRRYQKTPVADLKSVSALLKDEARLYIGTEQQGLFIWREGQLERFTQHEGLPSNRVTALTRHQQQVLVTTDFGVVALLDQQPGRLQPFSSVANLTSLAQYEGRLYGGLVTGGAVELQPGQPPRVLGEWQSTNSLLPVTTRAVPGRSPHHVRLQVSAAGLWGATAQGLYQYNGRQFKPVLLGPLSPLRQQHISSLSFDWLGRLWVGYFDGGIDLVQPATQERVAELHDETVREVNFLQLDAPQQRMLVATTAGLVAFDSRLQPRRYSEREGLISDSVTHIALAPEFNPGAGATHALAVVLSTGKGLTLLQPPVARSLSAFNGLTSNYLYTTLAHNGRLYVGTLGGLTELEGLRVTRTFTTANSKLAANWVTALTNVDGTLFIGTNGGGVQALTPAGEWLDFAGAIGRFDVNLNAMLFDGHRLYVGTLDRGVLIYDTRSREWRALTAGLSSRNVTAITQDAEHLYFGTTNGLTQIDRSWFD